MKTTLETVYSTGAQFYVVAYVGMYNESGDVFTVSASTLEDAVSEVSSRNWVGYARLSLLHTKTQQGQGLAVNGNGEVIQ